MGNSLITGIKLWRPLVEVNEDAPDFGRPSLFSGDCAS